MDQYLVIQGHARFYCPKEQVEYWKEQGCTIYAMQPVLIAGEEEPEAVGQQAVTVSGLCTTEGTANVVDTAKEEMANG